MSDEEKLGWGIFILIIILAGISPDDGYTSSSEDNDYRSSARGR